jgi:SAM-dependent methyltransferase
MQSWLMNSEAQKEEDSQAGLYDTAVAAEYFDRLWSDVVRGHADADFYLEAAKSAGGATLELGCGTGRILLPLAEAGHRVCGLELSPHMLDRCRTKLAELPREVQGRVRLVEGNMVEFELGEQFQLITFPFRSFQHLQSTSEQLACLACAHRHLAPGGRLILDLFQTDPRRMHDPEFFNERAIPGETTLPDGRRVRLAERAVALHRAIQSNDVELISYVTHPDGRAERIVNAFRVRYFFRYEVEHLLARAGFCVVEIFGSFDRTPLRDDSPEMIFIAHAD